MTKIYSALLLIVLCLLFSCSSNRNYEPSDLRPLQNQPYFNPAQQYPQNYYDQPYAPPASRFYSNPYAIMPTPYYNNDIDHYYTLPNAYQHSEGSEHHRTPGGYESELHEEPDRR